MLCSRQRKRQTLISCVANLLCVKGSYDNQGIGLYTSYRGVNWQQSNLLSQFERINEKCHCTPSKHHGAKSVANKNANQPSVLEPHSSRTSFPGTRYPRRLQPSALPAITNTKRPHSAAFVITLQLENAGMRHRITRTRS